MKWGGTRSFLDTLAKIDVMQVYKPKVKVGHVAPKIPLKRVKDRLACVRGSIVEAPLVRWLCYLFISFCVLGLNLRNHRTS